MATARIRPGWGRALKPWWIGALASGRVKDDAERRRDAAGRRPVLDTARRQSKLAIKVSRRGLASGGRTLEGLGLIGDARMRTAPTVTSLLLLTRETGEVARCEYAS